VTRTLLVFTLMLLALPAAATPRPDFQPELGSHLDLTTPLTDEAGATAPLSADTAGKPFLVLFGYHKCPNLCGVADLDLVQTLKQTGLDAATYRVLFISVDPDETAADAAASRAKLATASGGADLSSWRFLVGKALDLAHLESSVGMTVSKVDRDLYVHPVAISAVTPDGKLSGVLSGLDYRASDLRAAVATASAGKLGSLGEHLLLLCSAFLGIGRYTGAAIFAMRIMGLAVMAAIAGGIFLLTRRGHPA